MACQRWPKGCHRTLHYHVSVPVTLLFERSCDSLRVRHDLLRILLELSSVHLEQLCSQGTDLMIVGSSLQPREDSHVNPVFDVWDLFGVLEEDHACSGPSQ